MLIATKRQIYRLAEQSGESPSVEPIYQGPISAVQEGEKIAVIARQDGEVVILDRPAPGRPEDAQTPWQMASGIDLPIVSIWILEEAPVPRLLLGTDEGAHVFLMEGGPARRIESFEQLPCRSGWHTPWGGPPAVRTLAGTPAGVVYADIHVGSIMRSDDGGQKWQPVTPDLHEDVHEVATSGACPDRVAANTAKAVYVSEDRGGTWAHRGRDLDNRYGRALALSAEDADLMLATVSDGPHGRNVHGQLYRSQDAGRTWSHVVDPVPDSTPENINTGRVAFTRGEVGWVAIDTALYRGEDRATNWREIFRAQEPIEWISARS
jgi:hypothetical protein